MRAAHVAASLPVVGILWMLDAPRWIGQVWLTEQYLACLLYTSPSPRD